MKIFESGVVVNDKEIKIAIIISRFNYFINKNLLNSAIETLTRIGLIKNKNISIFKVPGAYEIPIITKSVIENFPNQFTAFIVLGTLIEGDTYHFKYISKTISNALMKISLENSIPIILGLLMTKNIEQAIERAGSKLGNKGYESAICTLEILNLIKLIKKNI
ncbi:6,7-dimethyl-8-ribityllumazine synthase [Buchnera aphidicola (Tetraneura ulmi)]|uniref:6,7-dimethyl-8-ribityllumazine synthase n=1 Tax=Buchnera aphidicola TaxID=9 RepID=UPI0034647952